MDRSSSGGNRSHSRSLETLVVNLASLCCGMQISWTSPCLPKISEQSQLPNNPLGRIITIEEASWIGSLLAVGGCLGTKVVEWLVDNIGRKKTLLFASIIPFIVAHILFSLGQYVVYYYLARILAGIAVSCVYSVVPIYLAEIAENCNRGFLCCTMITFQALGHLVTYIMGYIMDFVTFARFSLAAVLVTGVMIFSLIPESPYYLVSVGKEQEAEKALIRLRATVGRGIQNELNLIVFLVEGFEGSALKKAYILSISLVVFQTLSGISPVLCYTQKIFSDAGTSLEPAVCVIIIGFVQLTVGSITPQLVDLYGRKIMLFTSSLGACVAQFALSVYFYYKQKESETILSTISWIPIPALVTFMIFYFIGLGPLVWTVMAEVFPNEDKAAAASLIVMISWVFTFILCKFFEPIGEIIGMSGVFLFFAVSNLVSAVFCAVYLIETKGKNFQQIQRLLRQ
ncbi:hypothetical protein RI129_006351 [Pyrocoelia pectoralis]|uniref:Major facilitator superfamily (MFS) profile domain-containing protein n=1 Tax=Pyrocoelia pectoralis TaxID=417401 RepID=A0AAN7ZPH8_9COLE